MNNGQKLTLEESVIAHQLQLDDKALKLSKLVFVSFYRETNG